VEVKNIYGFIMISPFFLLESPFITINPLKVIPTESPPGHASSSAAAAAAPSAAPCGPGPAPAASEAAEAAVEAVSVAAASA